MKRTSTNNQNADLQISYISFLAVILFAWLASGCGASQSGGTPTTLTSVNSLASSANETICNQVSAPGVRFSAKLRVVDGNDNMVRVRITGLTNQFDQSSNMNIQFFRWKSIGGVKSLDSTPLSFHVEVASVNGIGGNVLTNNMTSLTMANIKPIVTSNDMNVSTAEQFFGSVDVIVHNLTQDYQVLTLSLRNGGNVVAGPDVLIPAFAANPATYFSTHASILNSLHPFATTAGYSDSQYLTMAQSACF